MDVEPQLSPQVTTEKEGAILLDIKEGSIIVNNTLELFRDAEASGHPISIYSGDEGATIVLRVVEPQLATGAAKLPRQYIEIKKRYNQTSGSPHGAHENRLKAVEIHRNTSGDPEDGSVDTRFFLKPEGNGWSVTASSHPDLGKLHDVPADRIMPMLENIINICRTNLRPK